MARERRITWGKESCVSCFFSSFFEFYYEKLKEYYNEKPYTHDVDITTNLSSIQFLKNTWIILNKVDVCTRIIIVHFLRWDRKVLWLVRIICPF